MTTTHTVAGALAACLPTPGSLEMPPVATTHPDDVASEITCQLTWSVDAKADDFRSERIFGGLIGSDAYTRLHNRVTLLVAAARTPDEALKAIDHAVHVDGLLDEYVALITDLDAVLAAVTAEFFAQTNCATCDAAL